MIALAIVAAVGWGLALFFGTGLREMAREARKAWAARDAWAERAEGYKRGLTRIRDLGVSPDREAQALAYAMLGDPSLPRPPDPPPCPFCKKGRGHWGGIDGKTPPADEDCPRVIAWRALGFGKDCPPVYPEISRDEADSLRFLIDNGRPDVAIDVDEVWPTVETFDALVRHHYADPVPSDDPKQRRYQPTERGRVKLVSIDHEARA